MVTGIIDVGSNTIKLAIFKVEADGSFVELVSRKATAGLAGYVEDDALSDKGKKKLCTVLRDFQALMDVFSVDTLYAFATASLRLVSNAQEIVDYVRQQTGISLELISGEEEARLSFLGAQHSNRLQNGLVLDIGGASSEIILVKDGAVDNLYSAPIGSLSLSIRVNPYIFPEEGAVQEMRRIINEQLKAVDHLFAVPSSTICFVGGTARAVYRTSDELNPRKGLVLDSHDISALIMGYEMRDRYIIRAIRRAAPDRVFTLLAGLLIMQAIIEKSEAHELLVSSCGLREGYLIDRVIGRCD